MSEIIKPSETLFMIGVVALVMMLASCDDPGASTPDKTVTVEVKLNDKPIPAVSDARIIVLPTGERVLVMTGDQGLATCCLLPPKPALKVEPQ